MGARLQRVCIFKIKPLAFISTTKSKNKPLLKQTQKLISGNAKVLTQNHEDKNQTQDTLRKAEAGGQVTVPS